MHRFPQDKTKRLRWLKALGLKDDDVGSHHRVCSRHFPEGDTKTHYPQLSLGKRFASPKKWWTGPAKRAKRQEAAQNLFSKESHPKPVAKNRHQDLHQPMMVKRLKNTSWRAAWNRVSTPTDDSLSTPTSSRALSSPDLVKLCTGFTTYSVFLAFYDFLGPSVNEPYQGVSCSVNKNDVNESWILWTNFFESDQVEA